MAIQPGSADPQSGSRGGDTAKLRLGRGRKRRPLVALVFALLAVAGLAVAGFGISGQVRPRQFTPAQKARIEAWEVARRWRTTPETSLFPAVVPYHLRGGQLGPGAGLRLKARRLAIGRQSTCTKAAGARRVLLALLRKKGCQAMLRATYADGSRSLVVTVGIAVMKDAPAAASVAGYLARRSGSGTGAVARRLVLHPLQVPTSPAATFGLRQRQLSWVVGAGPYVVLATVGYADGRPRVPIASDTYVYLAMTSLARAVARKVATPLAASPPVPACPGALAAC